MAEKKLIPFGPDNHTCVFGETRSGKTYGAMKSLKAQSEGVLFFNSQHVPAPGFTRAHMDHDDGAIFVSLQSGEKLNYLPSRGHRQEELKALIDAAYDYQEREGMKIYIVVDEVHLMRKEAAAACIELATTGLQWGLVGVFISQRPAKIQNDIMTQSTQHVFYHLNDMEGEYMRTYRMPWEDIRERNRKGGEYAYTVLARGELSGPFKV